MVWFTADTHFGHAKIIQHSHRPFTDVNQMDQEMIRRWNNVVGLRDEVWHLGDFNFKSELDTAYYVSQLHGRIHLVLGNHDDKYAARLVFRSLFASVQSSKYLRIDSEKVTLYHYAQRVWRNSHHGSLHLYGHSHGGLETTQWGRSMDVGVDCWNFTPVSFDVVRETLKDRPFTLHHPNDQLEEV